MRIAVRASGRALRALSKACNESVGAVDIFRRVH